MHRILVLADLHFGSIKDVNYVYSVMVEIFDTELVFNKTDAVIVVGDYFHKLMKINEDCVSLSINVMSYLVKACKRNKTKIRFVYGTESHEMSQYRLFNYHLTEPGVDFKVIETVTEEELLPGVNVLYIPEEYIEDKKEFYKDTLYSGKHYNYIFGHGTISEGMPMIKPESTSENINEKKIPRFTASTLSSVSDLYVFGHYHCHTQLDGGCYVGSLFRDSFGEEEPKGYIVIEDGKYTFIENKRAYVYKSYTYDESSDIYLCGENIIREIKKIKNENPDIFNGSVQGKIRMVFKTPPNVDQRFIESVKILLADEKNITSLIKMTSSIISEVQDDMDEEYQWILDNSLPLEDKIHRFIGMHNEPDMSLEELVKYIRDPLTI